MLDNVLAAFAEADFYQWEAAISQGVVYPSSKYKSYTVFILEHFGLP